MQPAAIMLEVQKLHNVSRNLQLLAERNPALSEALQIVSGNIRATATHLELLVAMKTGMLQGFDKTVN
jgi:hypothetical protein